MVNPVLDQITQSIAEVENTDPKALDESLERYVSTDAIRDLEAHNSNSWRLQFETRDHVIEVDGNSTILVDGERK
ncbi:HalOD1 output domain-containing protein [Halobellus salinisoli]|uniref:HalOD1 output domain-containing protein n=1 Tax=Halobellus salinisoli TaxID=3108500 RepID=UPI00300943AB